MGILLPSELDVVLDLLGFEWPNVDEDAVRDAAVLLEGLQSDLEDTMIKLDNKINNDLSEAFKSKTAMAFIDSYVENRNQNMTQMLDLLPTVAGGINLYADAVVAFKLKVIAELVITAAQIAAAIAGAVFTFGASLAIQAGIIAIRKKAIDIATDIMVDQLMEQLLAVIVEPLTDTLVGLVDAMLAWPLTSTPGGEVPKFDISYDLLDQLADAIQDCGNEQADAIDVFLSRVSALPITAG